MTVAECAPTAAAVRPSLVSRWTTLALAWQTLFIAANALTWRRLALPRQAQSGIPAHPSPLSRIAVLVPARNEVAVIETCVLSLLRQNHPNLHIWALDDMSEDGTGPLLTSLAARHPRLTVLQGIPPPRGWLGKNWACHQLATAALADPDTEYLLFTDADTVHQPDAVLAAVLEMQRTGAEFLTAWPRQRAESLAERLVQPMPQWFILSLLPVVLVDHTYGPRLASLNAGNGQFLLFHQQLYRRMDGHRSQRGEVREDVKMARRAKQSGAKTLLRDASGLVETRMYRGFGEVWRGYSKNLYAFLGRSPLAALAFAVLLIGSHLWPWLRVLDALRQRRTEPALTGLVQIGLSLSGRLLEAQRFQFRRRDALLHPLSLLMTLAILLNSMAWHYSGRGDWKGRRLR
jgi:chlorobactene glucosyltransferase